MKALLSTSAFLGLLLLLFQGAACERHPLSETMPDYKAKKEDQQKLTLTPKAPHFFH